MSDINKNSHGHPSSKFYNKNTKKEHDRKTMSWLRSFSGGGVKSVNPSLSLNITIKFIIVVK